MYTDGSNFKRSAYGTISYLPAAFGGACASVVIRHLLGQKIVLHKDKVLDKMKKQTREYDLKMKAKAERAAKVKPAPDDLVWDI